MNLKNINELPSLLDSKDYNKTGSSLGLKLCKILASSLNVDYMVKSIINKGSVFLVKVAVSLKDSYKNNISNSSLVKVRSSSFYHSSKFNIDEVPKEEKSNLNKTLTSFKLSNLMADSDHQSTNRVSLIQNSSNSIINNKNDKHTSELLLPYTPNSKMNTNDLNISQEY